MTNLSPTPGTPQTPTKAVVAAVVSLLTIGLGSVLVALQTNLPGEPTITTSEWIVIALAVLAAPVLTGGATYQATNKPQP